MAQTARILYDFEGNEENGEVIVNENDVIKILNMDIGDGWWECETSDGTIGLVPESYCEAIGEDGNVIDASGGMGGSQDDNWDEQYPDDEGEEEEERGDPTETVKSGGTDGTGSNESRPISPGTQSGIAGRHGTVKKNINRFSPFVKSGSEGFILGSMSLKREPRMNEVVKIVVSEEGVPMWEPSPEPYSVDILNPTKQTKYKGIKSFIAYEIQTSNSRSPSSEITRRYKHYDWFHERLVNKFTFMSVPPLPDKQFYGRYGEEFVEKRREKLQMWTNRIARHPFLSRSDVVYHFLHCRGSDGKEWKAGKRKAEKDPIHSGALYLTIEHPTVSVDLSRAEVMVEDFDVFMTEMEDSCTKMKAKFVDHCNKMSGPIMAEHHRMGAVVTGLANCFKRENKDYSNSLTSAIEHTADTYKEIGVLHAQQPKKDMLPAMDVLKEYLGMIQEFPKVADIHRGAVGKIKDCERMKEEGRIDFMEANDIVARSEKVSAVVQAEVYHFHHERVVDFRKMMRDMLSQQIGFYKEITGLLETALERFNESTDL